MRHMAHVQSGPAALPIKTSAGCWARWWVASITTAILGVDLGPMPVLADRFGFSVQHRRHLLDQLVRLGWLVREKLGEAQQFGRNRCW